MSKKEEYVEEFERFEASTGSPNKYHGDVAPHKPILLLSLLRMYEEGKIDLRKIDPTSEELLTTAEEIWNDWLGYDRNFDIDMPLYYLKRKDFWNPVLKDGESDPSRPDQVGAKIDHIYLEDDLIDYMKEKDNREKLIKALMRSGKVLKTTGEKKNCFSKQDKEAIREKVGS